MLYYTMHAIIWRTSRAMGTYLEKNSIHNGKGHKSSPPTLVYPFYDLKKNILHTNLHTIKHETVRKTLNGDFIKQLTHFFVHYPKQEQCY